MAEGRLALVVHRRGRCESRGSLGSGAPLPKDPRLEPRALVWLRNRHPEHAKGQAPVFRPILAGETPYEKVCIAASLLY